MCAPIYAVWFDCLNFIAGLTTAIEVFFPRILGFLKSPVSSVANYSDTLDWSDVYRTIAQKPEQALFAVTVIIFRETC